MKAIIAAGVTLALAATGGAALAGDIKAGSTLLDDSLHAQLERWTDAGEFNLTKVDALQPGGTSHDFHTAFSCQLTCGDPRDEGRSIVERKAGAAYALACP